MMNISFDIPEPGHISDMELMRTYCSSYFEALPFFSFFAIFIILTLYALFAWSAPEPWRTRIWGGLIFTCWAFALLNILVFSSVLPWG